MSRERIRLVALGIGVLAGLWALAPGHLYSIDGLVYFRGATALAYHGAFVFDPPLRWGDGVMAAPHGAAGLSLVYLPALLPFWPWAALEPVFSNVPYDQGLLYNDPIWVAIAWVQPAIVALSAILVARLVSRIGGSALIAVIAGLVYAFATPMLFYGRADFAQPLSGLMLLAALLLAIRHHDGIREAAWIVLGVMALAVLARPVDGTLTAGVLVVVSLVSPLPVEGQGPRLDRRIGRSARFLVLVAVGTVLGFAVGFLVNGLRDGRPLDFGYGSQGFTTPLPIGLAAYLLSPGRSILLYAPIALLAPFGAWALWRHSRSWEMTLLGLPCVAWLLVYACWQGLGGWAWGPRFLVPVLPCLVVLAASAVVMGGMRQRVAFGALAVGGLVANAMPLLVDPLQNVWGRFGDNVYPTAGFWRQFDPQAFQPVASLDSIRLTPLSHALDVVWLRATRETGGLSLAVGVALLVVAAVATLMALGIPDRLRDRPGRPVATTRSIL